MDRAGELAALQIEVSALRAVMGENDREIVNLVVNLAGEVAKNRAMIAALLGEKPAPLADAPAHDLFRLVTAVPQGLASLLLVLLVPLLAA